MTAKILVVDDASFIRDMVKNQLRIALPGVTLFEAVDGQRAQALLKKQPVDLILSDWEMPGMSGEELLHWVRAQPQLVATPFVMITSRGDREFVLKAVQAGVSDYLAKPFSADDLLGKVNKQLQKLGIDMAARPSAGIQGFAAGSVDALLGHRPKPAAAKARKPASKGKAQLRLASGSRECVILELSLQALRAVISRTGTLPGLFEQAVVDFSDEAGRPVARINGYLSSLQAAEPREDTRLVRISVHFVDDDPAKLDALSHYIAKL